MAAIKKFNPTALGNEYEPLSPEDPFSAESLRSAVQPATSGSRVKDVGLDVVRGSADLAGGVMGAVNLATAGAAQPYFDEYFRPQDVSQYYAEKYSPQRQQEEADIANTQGFGNRLGAIATRPGALVGRAVQSIPSMIPAVGAARAAALAGKSAGTVGTIAAIGEGATSAAQNAQQVITDNPDNVGGMYAQVPAGIITGAIAKAAGPFGGNIEAALASRANRLTGSLPGRVAKGFAGEGIEETLQSMQEQVFQNVAMGLPWNQGVLEAGAEGALVGGFVGGTVGGITGHTPETSVVKDEDGYYRLEPPAPFVSRTLGPQGMSRDMFSGEMTPVNTPAPTQEDFSLSGTPVDYGVQQGELDLTPTPDYGPEPVQGNLPVTRDLLPAPAPEGTLVASPEGIVGEPSAVQNARLSARLATEQAPNELGSLDRGTQLAVARASAENANQSVLMDDVASKLRAAYQETRGREMPKGVETVEKSRFLNGATSLDQVLTKLDSAIEKTRDQSRKETLTLWREKLTPTQSEAQNAAQEIPQQQSVPAEPQGGVGSGQAAETGTGNSVLNPAESPSQAQEVAQPTENAEQAWEDGYRVSENEPAFKDLEPELQSLWDVAVENRAATTKLFDNIVQMHRRNQRVARTGKNIPEDYADEKRVPESDTNTLAQNRAASAANELDFDKAIDELHKAGDLTDANRDLYSAVANGRTLDALRNIAVNGNKPQRILATSLIKLRVLPRINFNALEGDAWAEYRAASDAVTMDMGTFFEEGAMRQGTQFRSTLLHEIVHAATIRNLARVWYLDERSTFGDEISKEDAEFMASPQYEAGQNILHIYSTLLEQGTGNLLDQYGMTNPFEFVSEALTNTTFQRSLDAMHMDVGALQSRKSLWQHLVDAIRDLLGIPVTAGSALHNVLRDSATLLEDRVNTIMEGDWFNSLDAEGRSYVRNRLFVGQTNELPLEGELRKSWKEIRSTYGKKSESDADAKMADTIGDMIDKAKYNTPAADLLGAVKRFGAKFLNLHQVNDLYGNEMSMKDPDTGKTVYPIKGFIDNMLQMGRSRDDMLRVADAVKQKMVGLPKLSQKKLGTVLTGISELNGKTENVMTNGKVSSVKLVSTGDLPAEVTRLWNNLSQQEQKVYGEVISEVDRMRKELLAATKNNMEAYGEKGVGLLNEVLSAYTKVKGDYFPLMRFGDHIVVWKSDALRAAEESGDQKLVDELKTDKNNPHYIVQAFEHKGEANQLMDQLRENGSLEGANGQKVSGSVEYHKQQEYLAGLDRVPSGFVDKLNEVFDVDEGKVQTELAAAKAAGNIKKQAQLEAQLDRASYGKEMKNLVAALYVQALPEYSAAKRHLRRAGIQGYSTDAVRAYATYADRVASATAKAKYMRLVLNSLTQANRAAQLKEANSGDETYKDVVGVLRRHYDAIINPRYQSGEWQSWMTNAAYIWYLGMTPSFALTNLAQGPLISAPVMSARLGVSLVKAEGAIAKAAKDAFATQAGWLTKAEGGLFRRLYSSGPDYTLQDVVDENGNKTGETSLELDLSDSGLKKDEQELIKRLYKSSLVDLNQTHDITSNAEGISVKQREAMRAVTMFSHHSEVLNRLSTGLAAFRLAKEMGKAKGTETDPIEFAERIIRDTHGDYSNVAAPLYFKPGYNPLARIMFQFRKYQQMMLFLLGRNLKQSFGTGPESAVARRTLVGLMVTHGLAAGTLGMPLMGTAMWLVAAALNSDDDPWDTQRVEAEYRNFLSDTLGKEAGEIAAAGAFRAPGVRDVLPSTLGERVGQGQIAYPVRNMQSSNREAAKDTMARTIGTFVLGPTGGLTGDLLTAWEMFNKGDMQRGYEYASPKFLRDAFKTYRFANEGVVSQRGETRVSADKLSAVDEFWQLMGYTPADVSESYKATGAVTSYTQNLQDRRSAIITRYANALSRGDTGEAYRVRDELVQRFNSVNPTYRINPRDLMNAVRDRGRNEQRTNELGIVVNPRHRDMAQLGRFANVE